jgi:hypothetical protein
MRVPPRGRRLTLPGVEQFQEGKSCELCRGAAEDAIEGGIMPSTVTRDRKELNSAT